MSATDRTAAQRQRACRLRRRSGLVALKVFVPEFDLAAALIESARLTEAEAMDRCKVEAEAGDVLREWSRRWLEKAGHA